MMDYKEIMKQTLLNYYEQESEIPPYQITTKSLLNWFRGVIPNEPIDEHDVFEILTELGFRQAQKVLKEKVCIVEEDKKKGIRAEYDEVEVGRVLVWNLFDKLETVFDV